MGLFWAPGFMFLPSVRKICGDMVIVGEEWPEEWLDQFGTDHTSNVTTIAFTSSCIELGLLDRLLSYTQNLKSFTYSCRRMMLKNSIHTVWWPCC